MIIFIDTKIDIHLIERYITVTENCQNNLRIYTVQRISLTNRIVVLHILHYSIDIALHEYTGIYTPLAKSFIIKHTTRLY